MTMFSANPFLHNSRSSSFLIRDILGSEGALTSSTDKYNTFEQTLGSVGPGYPGPAHVFPAAAGGYPIAKDLGYFPTTIAYQDFKKGNEVVR